MAVGGALALALAWPPPASTHLQPGPPRLLSPPGPAPTWLMPGALRSLAATASCTRSRMRGTAMNSVGLLCCYFVVYFIGGGGVCGERMSGWVGRFGVPGEVGAQWQPETKQRWLT